MKTKQIIAIAIALVAVLALYFGTTNVKPKAKEHSEHDGHDHAPAPAGPMMGGAMMTAANFDSLETDIKKRLLSPQVKAEVENNEQQIARAPDVQAKSDAYESLGKRWLGIGQKGIAANYYEKAGDLVNSEKMLNFAAHLYEEGMNNTENPGIRKLFADGRVASLNRVLSINPKNDTASIDVAIAMIDQGDMMNGIVKLRDFADANPKNVRAQVTLGKMSLQTNQLDKAVERGKKVIEIDANNVDAYLLLGEASLRLGKTDEAIAYFTKAKKVADNPKLSQEIDAYIEKFKK